MGHVLFQGGVKGKVNVSVRKATHLAQGTGASIACGDTAVPGTRARSFGAAARCQRSALVPFRAFQSEGVLKLLVHGYMMPKHIGTQSMQSMHIRAQNNSTIDLFPSLTYCTQLKQIGSYIDERQKNTYLCGIELRVLRA